MRTQPPEASSGGFSLSKKTKIAFFAIKKQLENGYSTLANLGSFS